MNVIKLLFIIILILFPFGEVLRFDIGNNVVINPLDVAVGITGVWYIFYYLGSREISRMRVAWWYEIPRLRLLFARNDIFIFFILFSFFCFFSLLINIMWLQPHELLVSFLYLLRWVAYALIFFVTASFDKQFKDVIKKILLIDGIVIVVAGFLQYFFYNNLRNLYYLGWDDHLYRLFSTFFDPNFAGSFFVLFFLFVGGIFYHRLQKKNFRWLSFFIGLLIATVLSLLLTFSRSALLMFIVSVTVALILLNKKKLIFFLIGGVLLFLLIISPWFYLENINPFRVASSEARVETAQNALQIIGDHPLFGIGFNAYRYAQIQYGFRSAVTPFPSHADAGVDNSFLFVLATTGIFGFVAYFFLWYKLFSSRLAAARLKNIFAIVVVSSMSGLLVNALFINSLFYAPIMLWMWVVLGLED